MTEPKFMQLCRDNPGKTFPAIRRSNGEALRIAWTEDGVWVATTNTGSFNGYATSNMVVAANYTDPKPKRRFARMGPKNGGLAGDEAGLTFEQVLDRVRHSNCYTQVVEVVLYALNEDGTRGDLLYGMPEVD